ncbi:Cation/acetate symporter ActP [Rosistilla carotiformis]|uniref:Cation/acetate symporter ActP n=1 Tax=Rosistilla carotiformis TaxID=2528017 RepID=A0A518JX99_9BACT|nr:cation acetate symporter [Rosistilla carotiformis]QDV70160.1 Cation/acetate symporter ActP [Rosistilla carotiformis]
MIYEPSTIAVVIFLAFVGLTLGFSFYLGRQAKSSAGFFTAHGQIPWFVNGVAFAGDYLSAASFLGICGMIAFSGYDGFLYSIGYLAGWIVALFVVAEPMKRLGKFTFADALNSTFNSRGIKLVVGISTLVVSIFYLIPQMVGAGVLIQPLLGFPHWVGVVLVGATVICIVTSAGMLSTTWVQFLKGSLLVIFSGVLTYMILQRGFTAQEGGIDGHVFQTIGPLSLENMESELLATPQLAGGKIVPATGDWEGKDFIRTRDSEGATIVWRIDKQDDGTATLLEGQILTTTADGETLVNGMVKGTEKGGAELHPIGYINKLSGDRKETGPLGFLSFFRELGASEVTLWSEQKIADSDGAKSIVYYPTTVSGSEVLRPGRKFTGIRSDNPIDRLNFLSLMLALFCGTASLPHILIRYYTVKDEAAARKSTIVGIAAIGFFYVLTLYMGLGAMASGALDVTTSNMAAPLLAKSINEWLFAIISAIAFTTVLGTVSGLIIASAGAVTHDLLVSSLGFNLTGDEEVRVAKLASVTVGIIAIVLGILFKDLNVSFLVGWAFSIAASANLPALIMLLFWRGTTHQGIIAAVTVGMVSSLGWILLSGDTYAKVYGLDAADAIVPFSQPGIVTIPLGFITLVVVSLMTRSKSTAS